MSLKLSSAKRVETGGHHLPDYLLSRSCAAVLDSQGGRCQQSLSLYVPAECGSATPKAGETVRKVKHSSVTIANPLSALDRGTEYFSLTRTFRTAWWDDGRTSMSLISRFVILKK